MNRTELIKEINRLTNEYLESVKEELVTFKREQQFDIAVGHLSSSFPSHEKVNCKVLHEEIDEVYKSIARRFG